MMTDSKVMLRAVEPADVDAIYRWENDPESWTAGLVRQPMSRHQIWEWVAAQTANPAVDLLQARYIIAPAGAPDEPVGCIDLEDFDWINRRCGVGIYIEPSARRLGYARSALQLIIDHARTMLGLHQLYATVAADNDASRTLFQSAGFTISGRLRSWIRLGSSYTDAYLYQQLL